MAKKHEKAWKELSRDAKIERAREEVAGANWREVADGMPRPVEIVRDLLATDTITLVVGKPGAGKSWVALDLALAIATGSRYLGNFEVAAPQRVLLVGQDTPTSELMERIRRMTGGDDVGRLKVLSQHGLRIDGEEGQFRLAAEAGTAGAKVVVIDSLTACVGSSFHENQADSAKRLFDRLKHVQCDLKLTIILVHHQRKDATTDSIDAVRRPQPSTDAPVL